MKKLRILLRVTGTIRIALGLFSLLAPAYFLESIGHTIPEDDIFYPFGMLASRFVVLGVMFIYITKDPMKRRLWYRRHDLHPADRPCSRCLLHRYRRCCFV
jgi:hypothetical protein